MWKLLAAVAALAFGIWWLSQRGGKATRRNSRGAASGMARAGMLEMQAFLEPEKKIEILLNEQEETDEDYSGGPDKAGKRSEQDR